VPKPKINTKVNIIPADALAAMPLGHQQV